MIEYITLLPSLYGSFLDGWGNMHEKTYRRSAHRNFQVHFITITMFIGNFDDHHQRHTNVECRHDAIFMFTSFFSDVHRCGFQYWLHCQVCSCRRCCWLLVNVAWTPAKWREDHNSMAVCVPSWGRCFLWQESVNVGKVTRRRQPYGYTNIRIAGRNFRFHCESAYNLILVNNSKSSFWPRISISYRVLPACKSLEVFIWFTIKCQSVTG